MTSDEPLKQILKQARHSLFWDERLNPPDLDDPRLLLRIMEMGNWGQVLAMEKVFSREKIIHSLKNAPYGIISRRTLNFWCLRLGMEIPYSKRLAIRQPYPGNPYRADVEPRDVQHPPSPSVVATVNQFLQKQYSAGNGIPTESMLDVLVAKIDGIFRKGLPHDYTVFGDILKQSPDPMQTLGAGLRDLKRRDPLTNLNLILRSLCWFDRVDHEILPQSTRTFIESIAANIGEL